MFQFAFCVTYGVWDEYDAVGKVCGETLMGSVERIALLLVGHNLQGRPVSRVQTSRSFPVPALRALTKGTSTYAHTHTHTKPWAVPIQNTLKVIRKQKKRSSNNILSQNVGNQLLTQDAEHPEEQILQTAISSLFSTNCFHNRNGTR